MIPIYNSSHQCEFHLILGHKFLRCCFSILKALKANVSAVEIYNRGSQKFDEMAFFISKTFKNHYNADIKVSMPKIMAVVDQKGAAMSALAIRPAASEKLFLEQYLDSAIEEVLSKKFGHKVTREEIVEIGSLASMRHHSAKFLYVALASYLKARKYKYVVATGTQYLYDYFHKAHLHPLILAKANKDKLLDKTVDWGSYYESNPQVMVLDVLHGNRILGGFLGIVSVPSINQLYPKISYN